VSFRTHRDLARSFSPSAHTKAGWEGACLVERSLG
jgi:hypothetical protein